MIIYIAGPYTSGDVAQNVRAAIDAAEAVAAKGHTPVVPHLDHFWHMIYPHPWDFWLRLDLDLLALCDVVLRLPGSSAGADDEVAIARSCGMRVFYSLDDLP